jgi:AraC-like DNA-binding protein
MKIDGHSGALAELAATLAPRTGYNPTALDGVRLLRSDTVLEDVPVLYRPGAIFVLRGAKQGFLDGEVYRYDTDHYLAVSLPVPFRMASQADCGAPLLAIYVDFDLRLAAEIANMLGQSGVIQPPLPAKSLVSSRMTPILRAVLRRMLLALRDPVELAVLGPGLMRDLHFRILTGPQGGALMAALQREGPTAKIVESLVRIRDSYNTRLTVPDLAAAAGMSVASFHAHFKALTGNAPMQYVKAIRLHEARLMIARQVGTVSLISEKVGYASPAQFSRDFRRHFGRSATEEAKWMREHLG